MGRCTRRIGQTGFRSRESEAGAPINGVGMGDALNYKGGEQIGMEGMRPRPRATAFLSNWWAVVLVVKNASHRGFCWRQRSPTAVVGWPMLPLRWSDICRDTLYAVHEISREAWHGPRGRAG